MVTTRSLFEKGTSESHKETEKCPSLPKSHGKKYWRNVRNI
jgi:hypothetical protein